MAQLTLIAAQDRAGAIGKDNDIPWHVPEDLAFFKRRTAGGVVIMGRRTWDSLPRKPLPGRLNIVVTRSPQTSSDPDIVFTELDEALNIALAADRGPVFCIGGEQIFRAMLPDADCVLLTVVETEISGADTFFPQLDDRAWRAVATTVLRDRDPACAVTEYRRVAAQAGQDSSRPSD